MNDGEQATPQAPTPDSVQVPLIEGDPPMTTQK